MSEIQIPSSFIKSIADHAMAAHPAECCGLLGGCNGVATSWHPSPNAAPDPQRRFAIAPSRLFRAFQLMRAAGESLLAIYHSHPHTAPRPSATDIKLAFYPEATYLIFSRSHMPSLQGYRICSGRVSRVRIIIV